MPAALFAPRRSLPAAASRAPAAKASSGFRAASGRPSHVRDAAALLLFASALFAALALASYRGDPMRPEVHGEDWVGPVGAAFAGLWAETLGLVACLVPIELALFARPLLQDKPHGASLVRFAGDVLVAITLAALAHVAFPEATVFGAMPLGGAVGELFGELLRSLFSTVGSYIVGLTVVGLILIGRATFSFIEWMQKTRAAAEALTEKSTGGVKMALRAWAEAQKLEREELERKGPEPRIVVAGEGEGERPSDAGEAIALALADVDAPRPSVAGEGRISMPIAHAEDARPVDLVGAQRNAPLRLSDPGPKPAPKVDKAEKPTKRGRGAGLPAAEAAGAAIVIAGTEALGAAAVPRNAGAASAEAGEQDEGAASATKRRKAQAKEPSAAQESAKGPTIARSVYLDGRGEASNEGDRNAPSGEPERVSAVDRDAERARGRRAPRPENRASAGVVGQELEENRGPALPLDREDPEPHKEDPEDREDPEPHEDPEDREDDEPHEDPEDPEDDEPHEGPEDFLTLDLDAVPTPSPIPPAAPALRAKPASPSAVAPVREAKPAPPARAEEAGLRIVDTSSALRAERPAEPKAEPKRVRPSSLERFELPDTELLEPAGASRLVIDEEQLKATAAALEKTLADYGVSGRVEEIHPGPTVTTFEVSPAAGTKVSKVAGLADDLALGLSRKVRIIAPIPGKNRIGFEVPNEKRAPVNLRELVEDRRFLEMNAPLPCVLGRDIIGAPYYADLASMPHVIVAGATGAGKSVGLNVMLTSLLFRKKPDELKLLMIDPKVVELAPFDRIPHMLLPVVTDMKQASNALKWAVDEMERRYQLFANAGTRNIASYNGWVERVQRGEAKPPKAPKKVSAISAEGLEVSVDASKDGSDAELPEKLPYIVIVVDEFADLMMQQGKDVEASVARLAQKARAAGMHVILATQRPSVDVITGMIKANFPTRIAFRVAQKVDSRTILDEQGAEHLLGRGDMLVKLNGSNETRRVQCPFCSEEEVQRVTDHLRAQGEPVYDEAILKPRDEDGEDKEEPDAELDPMFDAAVRIVAETRRCSTSWIQRKLGVGYNRAAKMVEAMEKRGVVGPANGAKDREVLISPL